MCVYVCVCGECWHEFMAQHLSVTQFNLILQAAKATYTVRNEFKRVKKLEFLLCKGLSCKLFIYM